MPINWILGHKPQHLELDNILALLDFHRVCIFSSCSVKEIFDLVDLLRLGNGIDNGNILAKQMTMQSNKKLESWQLKNIVNHFKLHQKKIIG